jgi:hypothetical protein
MCRYNTLLFKKKFIIQVQGQMGKTPNSKTVGAVSNAWLRLPHTAGDEEGLYSNGETKISRRKKN